MLKPKLKYRLCGYVNNDVWRRGYLERKSMPLAIIATLNLKDPETADKCLHHKTSEDNTACLITIGYERRNGTGNPQGSVQGSDFELNH
jgi:hypothetical protein